MNKNQDMILLSYLKTIALKIWEGGVSLIRILILFLICYFYLVLDIKLSEDINGIFFCGYLIIIFLSLLLHVLYNVFLLICGFYNTLKKNLILFFDTLNNFLNGVCQFLNKAKTKQNLIKLFSLIQICLIVLITLKFSCYLTEDTVEIVCQKIVNSVDLLAEKLKILIKKIHLREIAAEKEKLNAFLEKQNKKNGKLVKLLEWVPEYPTVINELLYKVFVAFKKFFKG